MGFTSLAWDFADEEVEVEEEEVVFDAWFSFCVEASVKRVEVVVVAFVRPSDSFFSWRLHTSCGDHSHRRVLGERGEGEGRLRCDAVLRIRAYCICSK